MTKKKIIYSGDESDIGDLSDNENDEEEDNIPDFNINDLDISGDESDIGDLSDNENDEEEDNIPDFNINDLDIVFVDDNFERNGVSEQINSNDDEEWESEDELPHFLFQLYEKTN
ncbi:hypothetical protein QE152_g39772 [Popillia japonica]|uniref:Uncharacterized protein n=1 Tax=Popillia japonica TaxID=7064 RepID=A0AAW1HTU7_POPJA